MITQSHNSEDWVAKEQQDLTTAKLWGGTELLKNCVVWQLRDEVLVYKDLFVNKQILKIWDVETVLSLQLSTRCRNRTFTSTIYEMQKQYYSLQLSTRCRNSTIHFNYQWKRIYLFLFFFKLPVWLKRIIDSF